MSMPTNRFVNTIRKLGAGKDKDKKLSIIILNAHPGYRTKTYGPKCLFKIDAETSILERQIQILKSCYPNSEIIVTIGFDSDKIIKKNIAGVRYVENQLFETTNIVEEIRLALNNCETSNVLIIYGDIIFDTAAIDNITKTSSTILYIEDNNLENDEVGLNIVNDKITAISYGLSPKWSYIIYLTNNELYTFKSLCSDKTKNKMYPFELINILVSKSNNKITITNPKNGKITKVDSKKDITNENSNS